MGFPDSLSQFVPIIHTATTTTWLAKLQPVSCNLVLACRPTVASLCEGVNRITYLMSMLLPLQKCSACLVRLIWMVLLMGGKWLYSCYFVGCCFQDLLNITRRILIQFPSSFFSERIFSALIWYIHRVLLTQPLLGRNLILFLRT